MLQFFDTLADDSGNALLGATVTVTNFPSGSLANIFSTNGTSSPIANSVVAADITGQISFYIPDGAYTLTYAYKGTNYKVRSPVQLMDPMGFVAITDTGAANAYAVVDTRLPAQLYQGLKVEFKGANTNTGASTFALNGLAPQPLNLPGANPLTAGMIQAGGLNRIEWDGAQWQLVGSQGQPTFPVTPAETSASVVPTNLGYQAGDLRRYGGVPGNVVDASAAWASAVSQAQKANGASVFVPAGGFKILTGTTCTTPIKIYGDNYGYSFLQTPNDITILSVTGPNVAGFTVVDLQLFGKGAGALLPALLFTNANSTILQRVQIQFFGVGVRYAPGINSSFFNSIIDSRINSNNTINIDAQAQTNLLRLTGVSFGGAPTATGLKCVDSLGLSIYGGDCEGCSLVGVDLDATVASIGGHVISGVDFEFNTSSAGDIRIGHTATVKGVTVGPGTYFLPGASNPYAINPLNCDGLTVDTCYLLAGYSIAAINLTNLGTTVNDLKVINSPSFYGAAVADFSTGGIAVNHGATAIVLVNGNSIVTAGKRAERFNPAGNVTGLALNAGSQAAQIFTMINESAFTITMDVSGVSLVASGTGCVIAAKTQKTFYWDTGTSLWYSN